MTLAAVIAAGKGILDYRLVIEGCDTVFCTEGLDFGAQADGRERVPGLRREGLGFSESVYLAGAEHDVRISPVQIDDAWGPYLGRATRLFSSIAEVVDQLAVALGELSSDTTVTVRDSALFSTSTWYYLGTETIKVTAKPTGTTLTVVRGEWDSAPQFHHLDTGDYASVTPIYDRPVSMVGRRVWLYAHGETEHATSAAGTIVWRGVVAKDPSEKNGVWTLQVESRLKLLDASLAGFDNGLRLAGCYYPGESGFKLYVQRSADATEGGPTDAEVEFTICGWWPTRSAFLAYLVDLLNTDATISGWGASFEGRETPDGSWDLWVRTPNPARFIQVQGGSVCDGWFFGRLQSESVVSSDGFYDGADVDTRPSTVTVGADTLYRVARSVEFSAPSSYAGASVPANDLRKLPLHCGTPWFRGTEAEIAAYPIGRMYLTTVGGLTTSDSLTLTMPGEDAVAQTLQVTAVGANSVTAYVAGSVLTPPDFIAAGAFQPELVGAVRLVADGDLADLRDAILSRAPRAVNRGQCPWLTSDDVASWTSAVDEAHAGRPFLAHRQYTFGKSIRARDLLREECRVYGLFPYLDASAKIGVRLFTLDTTTPTHVVTSDQRIIDDGFGTVGADDDGLVTVVEVLTGYDPAEDKHQGETHRFRDLAAVARVKREAVLEIKPRSRPVGAEMTWADAVALSRPVTTIFGSRRTQTVRFDVTIELFGVLVGDPITITIPQLPGDGDRGIWTSGQGLTSRTGYVVSRSWDLASGRGELGVLLHELAIAGYTPSGRVSSASGGGTSWTLTLEASRYSGVNDAATFTVGDSIILREWDSATPTTRDGEVTSVNAGSNQIGVLLTSAWGGLGGGTYVVQWHASDYAITAPSQVARGAYVAGSTGRIDISTALLPADRFAP